MCEGRQGREVLMACFRPPVRPMDRESSSIESHFDLERVERFAARYRVEFYRSETGAATVSWMKES